MGLFEIHCHTSETSICGKVTAHELVRMHKDAGFEGVCITDHFNELHMRGRFKGESERFLKKYRLAREYGKEIGLKVLLGIEYTFEGSSNDYLLYGINEEFVILNPRVHQLGLSQLKNELMTEEMLLIQAHPMRDKMEYVDLDLVDGLEVVNGNERINPRNGKVKKYAELNGLVMTAASDFHRKSDLFKAVMNFDREIKDERDLVREIKEGRYEMIDNTRWRVDRI